MHIEELSNWQFVSIASTKYYGEHIGQWKLLPLNMCLDCSMAVSGIGYETREMETDTGKKCFTFPCV